MYSIPLSVLLSTLLCLQQARDNIGIDEGLRRRGTDQAELVLQNIDAFVAWLIQTPRIARNDCFFVTTAQLLNTTVQDISERTRIPAPPPGEPAGISIEDIVEGLTRLGLRFRVWQSQPHSGGGPIRHRPRPQQDPGVTESQAFVQGAPRVVGVAYVRTDGTGHVVVGRNPGRPYSRYTDYQAHPNGVDVTQEVRASRIHGVFYIDTQASTGDLIDAQRPAVERMEIDEEQTHTGQSSSNGGVEPMEVDEDGIAAENEETASGFNVAGLLPDLISRIQANLLSESVCRNVIGTIAFLWANGRSKHPRALREIKPLMSDQVHSKEP
ncbi:hypothetical protein HRG_012809 [Hirsutella rhossiliensis]